MLKVNDGAPRAPLTREFGQIALHTLLTVNRLDS